MTSQTLATRSTRCTAAFSLLVAGVIGVWVVAVLFGLWSHVAGAVAAIVSGVAAVVLLSRLGVFRQLTSAIPFGDLGIWAVLVMAASPLLPARIGPAYAGVSLDDLPLLVGTALGLLSVLRIEGWRKLIHPVSIPLWLFAVWNGVSVFLAGHVEVGELTRGIGRWGLVALAFSLLLRIAARPGRARFVLGAVVFVGLVEALFGLWSYLVDWKALSPEVARLIGLELWRPYQPLYGTTPGRIVGTLGVSSNFFGALMLMPAILAGAVFTQVRRRREQAIWAAATGALFFALVLSYTRASMVGLLIGFLALLVMSFRPRLAVLVAVLVVLGVVLTPAASRFVNEGNDRLQLARKAVETVKEKPVTGLGSGDFVAGQFDEKKPVLIGTPHNSFLLAASETGVPGGLLLFAAAVVPGMAAAVGVIRRRGGVVLSGATAGLTAFGVQTLSNNLFHIPNVAVFYWLVAAAAVAMATEPVTGTRDS